MSKTINSPTIDRIEAIVREPVFAQAASFTPGQVVQALLDRGHRIDRRIVVSALEVLRGRGVLVYDDRDGYRLNNRPDGRF